MLLLYPGELYRLLGASSLIFNLERHQRKDYCKNDRMNGLFKVSDKTYTLGNLHPQHWEENKKSIIVLFIVGADREE
jgi:hypothetical protein